MKIKKIGIIILALVLTGGVAGVVGYRINLQDKNQQKLEIQKATEVKAKNAQIEVSSKNEQVEVKCKNEQTKGKSNNKQANVKTKNEQVKVKQGEIENKKPKKEKLTHSDFESKVQSYVAGYRKSGDGISTFKQNLDSINTKDLNTEDKKQLNNLKLAANDVIMLIGNYVYVKEFDDPNIDKTMKCAKETLDKVNTENLVATGVMSKTDVDKRISYLRKYVESTQPALDKEKKLNKQHSKLKTKQEKEAFYYKLINETMQRQRNYINSIKDPEEKGQVESDIGAANGM